MRFAYKVFPATNDPGFNGAKETWMPIAPVRLLIGHTQTPRFDALVDSGAFTTYFHSDMGRNYGLRIEDGQPGELRGVIDAPPGRVFYHPVKLCIGESIIKVTAGFYDKLSAAGILGRHGFFEHFAVHFDPSNNPPGFEINRIHRA